MAAEKLQHALYNLVSSAVEVLMMASAQLGTGVGVLIIPGGALDAEKSRRGCVLSEAAEPWHL